MNESPQDNFITRDCCSLGCLTVLFAVLAALVCIALVGSRSYMVAGWRVEGSWLILPFAFVGAGIAIALAPKMGSAR